MRIDGCIEFASASGCIGGWVRCEDPDMIADLALVAGDVVITQARPDRHRDDFGGMFGYWIDTAGQLDLFDLISGRVKLLATVPGLEVPAVIGPLEHVREQAIEEFVQTRLSALGEPDLDRLARALKDEAVDRAVRQGERHVANRRKRDALSRQLGTLEPAAPPAIAPCQSSPVEVPLGHLSLDGTALVGQQGYLFLVGGSNSVLDQYLADPEHPGLVDAATRWLDRFAERRAACDGVGARYLQIVVPEKLAVARDLFPWSIPVASPLLERIEAAVSHAPQLAQGYVSGLSVLSALDPGPRCESFRRTDSHLSCQGIFRILQATLEAMNVSLPQAPAQWKEVLVTGDLAERFFGVPLFETIRLPSDAFCDALSNGVELTEAYNPPGGGHVGTRYVWKNASAAIPMKVVAFGNSYFERGGDAGALSWWFARLFAEFHFVWDPRMDADYVAAEKPDWVICQTVERFLPSVPDR